MYDGAMTTFENEYARLNQAQKQAVDTIEGPVMVVAGPGTGKTQVLGLRVANILKKTHANPGNVLCLTFSNAGATAMRDRLRRLIGGDAYAVTVSTVHGFCDALIARNPTAFSEWGTKKSLGDLERYRMMQSIIDDVGDTMALIHPKHPYDRIPDIFSRISECKREGLSNDDLAKVAQEYDVQMEGKSKKGTKAHGKNILQAKKFRDFAELFKRYNERLEEEALYDYDDMILTVMKALEEEEWLLASLQERYQYILVDEAQDLNGAQWKVIERLTTYAHVPNDPNFFLVGDDDQAIYRFQGANLAHMLAFRDRFPKAPVIVLTQNYRSTQHILDAAGRLIARNEERLIGRIPGLKKDLVSAAGEPGIEPVLLRAPSDVAEPWLIADIAEERIAAGVQPEEIAVLVQTNSELRPIYDVLRARSIPVVLQGKADLLTHPIVRQAIAIMRSIIDLSGDALFTAMGCQSFDCHPADLARISEYARQNKISRRSVLTDLERLDLPFINLDAIVAARDLLEGLRAEEASTSVLEMTERILREANLSSMAATDPLDLAVVETFFQYVKNRCLDEPAIDMRKLLHDIDLYADEEYGDIRLTYQIPHLISSGVQLLTAHQSKGLEFHTVMLSGFREGHWDERKNRAGLSVPEDLLFGWEKDVKAFEKNQDERRVAYVAMTRAKRELIMLCPKEFSVGERTRSVAPSAFFAEAGPLPERDAALKDPEHSSLLIHTPARDMDSEMKGYLQERLKRFALSPSSLQSFLIDPQLFLYEQLLNQPRQRTESSARAIDYGSATHWALRKWAEAAAAKKSLTLEEFLKEFEWHMQERSTLTQKQRADMIRHGKESLPEYFAQHLHQKLPVLHAIEQEYAAMMPLHKDPALVGVPLKGKIDRIDRLTDSSADAMVIDYKTGRPKAPAEIRGGLDPGVVSRTSEGEYFRQMVFYALLLELKEPLLHPQVFRLAFIGERGEEPIMRDFSVTDAEKEDLRKLIADVWRKIVSLDFTQL